MILADLWTLKKKSVHTVAYTIFIFSLSLFPFPFPPSLLSFFPLFFSFLSSLLFLPFSSSFSFFFPCDNMKKLPGFGVCGYQKLGLTSDEVSGYHDLGPPPARGRGKVPGCQKLVLTPEFLRTSGL